MALYTKDSLEKLKDKIDLVDVLTSHLELKKAGAAYKGLCPFHDEKTPSFTIQKGDRHYHCFGCGAHGDAIQFMTDYVKMNFSEAVEHLAAKFHVPLELVEGSKEESGPSKKQLKAALEHAKEFFRFHLHHTDLGHEALKYLRSRDIDLNFINQFEIGLSPIEPNLLKAWLKAKKVYPEEMLASGLLNSSQRDFFSCRIMFPIKDPQGQVIGFSGRKFREETFGGKYINTPETPLFKKSKVLFGLDQSRKRIAKERRALIVEGQLDCLRLIFSGITIAVAGQGTAFGEGHVKELMNLGVNEVFLALDADKAGQEAAAKIGHLFQKEGISVKIVQLSDGDDPDSFLRNEGADAFIKLMEDGSDYLAFLVKHESKAINTQTPAGKNELIQKISQQIRQWNHPLMVHESLRKLAELAEVPAELVGLGQEALPQTFIKRQGSLGQTAIDPDRILESDLLRWLLFDTTGTFLGIANEHLNECDFHLRICREVFSALNTTGPCDIMTITEHLDGVESRLLLSELLQKKVDREKSRLYFMQTIQKILDRNWLRKREEIKMKIQSNKFSEDEVFELIRAFDELKKAPPKVNDPFGVL